MDTRLDEIRERSRKVWDAMAPGWERAGKETWEYSRPVSEWLVARVDPRPGQVILDLAAGLGETAFLAAPRVGPTGRVLVTDFAAGMLNAARRRAAEFGVTNAEFRELDAERMTLDAESVDGVVCRWGYMLMADPAAAFRETHRVLRPGGRLAFSVFGPPEANAVASLVGRILVDERHTPPPAPGAPGIFALSDQRRLRDLVDGAGFAPLEIQEVRFAWRFASLLAYWQFLTEAAGAISPILRGLTPEAQAKVQARLEDEGRPFRSGEGFVFPVLCLNATTRKAARA